MIRESAQRERKPVRINVERLCGLQGTVAKINSAKGAARTAKDVRNKLAPHSVLRVILRSAKGAARTAKDVGNKFAPHSVLRVIRRRQAV